MVSSLIEKKLEKGGPSIQISRRSSSVVVFILVWMDFSTTFKDEIFVQLLH